MQTSFSSIGFGVTYGHWTSSTTKGAVETYVAGQLTLANQVARDTLKVVFRDEGSAGLALTSDIWTSYATLAYNTTTCHLIDNDWTMKAYVLGTKAFPGHHTGVRIAELLEQTISDLEVPSDHVYAHVHDQAANVELARRILFESSSLVSEVCRRLPLPAELRAVCC